MAIETFAKHYLRRIRGKLSLQERVINGDSICCFFDVAVGQCTIYESRPGQCRAFPFWEHYKSDTQALYLECPGVSPKDAVV